MLYQAQRFIIVRAATESGLQKNRQEQVQGQQKYITRLQTVTA